MTENATREKRRRLMSKLAKTKDDPQPIQPPKGMFFCEGHLDYLPIEKQSRDARYCKDCLAVIEISVPPGIADRDYWLPNKGIFFTGGMGHGLTPNLKTVCLGKETDVLARMRQKTPTSGATVAKKGVPTPQNEVNHHPRTFGTPFKDLPADKISDFLAQGLGARAIAKKLKEEGIEASRMTVYRAIQRIKGQLELPLSEES